MSMNRDNFRANQPPSKVLHIRNLPPDVTEEEVVELCRPFGRIVRTRVNTGQTKNQAFVEFDNVTAAIQMITYYVGREPPKVRNKVVYLQYSTRQEIGSSFAAAPDPSGNVLLVIMDNIKVEVGPTLDTLHMVFSAFGKVAKITMFEKASGLQALVQYSMHGQAREAKEALDGRTIPDYLVPNHPGAITMKVSYSQHTDLNVRCQSERSRDYTNPYLPNTAEAAAVGEPPGPAAAAAPAPATSATPAIVLCQFENVQYPPTVDALRMVFSTYGTVQKLTISDEGGAWQAHVQYDSKDGARKAQDFLNGYSMYEGGVNKLRVSSTTAPELVVRSNTERTWDATLAGSASHNAAGTTRSAGPTTAAAAGRTGPMGPAPGPHSSSSNPASAAGVAAAGHRQASQGGQAPGSREPAPFPTGADWEAAHEAMAQEAAAIMANAPPRGHAAHHAPRGPPPLPAAAAAARGPPGPPHRSPLRGPPPPGPRPAGPPPPGPGYGPGPWGPHPPPHYGMPPPPYGGFQPPGYPGYPPY